MPGPPVRREDPVVAAAGRGQLARRHDGQAGRDGELQPVLLAVLGQVLAAPGGVVRDVVGDEDGVRLYVRRHLDDLGGGIAGADHEVALALAQCLAQIAEGFGQEARAVRRAGDGRVDDEHRHHLPGLVARQVQRRVVMQPEVAREQHDRGFHRRPF